MSDSSLRDSITERLRDLSKRLATVVCVTKEFEDSVLGHLSDDFRSVDERGTRKLDRTQFLEFHRNTTMTLPDGDVPVEVSSAELDELRGRAIIWLQCRRCFSRGGLQGECVWQLLWERRKGRWVCVKKTEMCGVSEYV